MKSTGYRWNLILTITMMVLLISAGITFAAGQFSANYAVDMDVISGGGGEGSSTNYDTEHTTGQSTAIGVSSSSSYNNYAGFWYAFNDTETGGCGTPHWNKPDASNIQMHLAGNLVIDSVNADTCDEVAVFDSGDQLVGTYRVDMEGLYGDLVVYGDSPQTPDTDEGAPAGDNLTVKVWDASSQTEYTKSNIRLQTPVNGLPPYVQYQPPLAFNANQFIFMDIEVILGCGEISLYSEWNFFGWPCNAGYYEGTEPQQNEYASGSTLTKVDNLGDALIEIGLSQESYLVVVGPNGKVYVPDSPFNTLKSLLPGLAYWIYMSEDGKITMPGNILEPSSSLSLTSGWMQIGYWGEDGLSPEDAFRCIDGQYDVVVNGKGNVYVPNSPFNTLKSIYQVEGYYIHTTSAVTLKYDCQ